MANNQSYNSQANLGSFVPSTFIWEIQELQATNIDPKLKDLLIRLYQNLNLMQIALNQKEFGNYAEQETLNGKVYFPDPGVNSLSGTQPVERQVFRKAINFGPLPDKTTKSVPHHIDINNGYSFTRIYGTASNETRTKFIPITYSTKTINESVEICVTDTDVVIETQIDYSSYNTTYVVLEYLKN